MKRILIDVEGDGLLPELTKIHCICTVDVDTQEVRDFGPAECNDVCGAAIEYLATADILVAHNSIAYDFPALEIVLDFSVPVERQRDTLVISRVKYPNLKETDGNLNANRLKKGEDALGKLTGSHSLEAWGIRLKWPKLHTDITDWSQWTPQIQERCANDVQLNLRLWQQLNPDAMPQGPIDLEHRCQHLTQKITAAGWPFDVKAAGELHAHLIDEKDKAEKALVEQFGSWYQPKGTQAGLFTPKRDNPRLGYSAGAPFTRIERVSFNPRSAKHIERCLRALGWKPTEFTDKGNPKLDEEQLENIAQTYPQAQGLTHYLMLQKRLGALAEGDQAWLKKVRSDGRIHASYNPMGTVTSRASHYDPNIAQVPANASPYGKECRGLFGAPEGWDLLGADMASLEGRCLAHYLAKHDGGAYGEILLKGDPHWAVVKAMGFLDCERDKHNQLHQIVREFGAKRGFYAMLYGAGAEKVGRVILDACRMSANIGHPELLEKCFGDWAEAPSPRKLQLVGGQAKRNVIEGIPGFAQLMKRIKHILWRLEDQNMQLALPGLDGRRLPVRSEHSALNVLLQSAGAILCKRWICDAYDALIADGLEWEKDFIFVGWIHDELQVAARTGLGERVGRIVTAAAREAGKPYGFRLPLDSDYKIGRTWADTH